MTNPNATAEIRVSLLSASLSPETADFGKAAARIGKDYKKSSGQIAAIKAWFAIEADAALKRLGIPTAFRTDFQLCALTYIISNSNFEERVARLSKSSGSPKKKLQKEVISFAQWLADSKPESKNIQNIPQKDLPLVRRKLLAAIVSANPEQELSKVSSAIESKFGVSKMQVAAVRAWLSIYPARALESQGLAINQVGLVQQLAYQAVKSGIQPQGRSGVQVAVSKLLDKLN